MPAKIKALFLTLLAAFLIIIAFLAINFTNNKSQNCSIGKVEVSINNISFCAQLADTPVKQQQGLSGRANLGENEGMLFVFSRKTIPRFWMKDMEFPIDIIWISNNKIVDIHKNVPIPQKGALNTSLPTYQPSTPINYVLELNAGTVENLNIKIGDSAKISGQ